MNKSIKSLLESEVLLLQFLDDFITEKLKATSSSSGLDKPTYKKSNDRVK